jgi:uncharacterized membrane protein SpoIIM required for sporulation
VVGQVIIAILLVRIGIAHFNREELISREFDSLDLRWGLVSFWNNFRGEAHSPMDWYKKEIKDELLKIRMPALLVIFVLIGGVLLGANLANRFVIPPELINMDTITMGSIEGLESVRLFETGSVPAVWFYNLRLMVLASIMGVFSFGVLALIVMLFPILLIGYFTATMASAGLSPLLFLLAFVIPHGVLEIPAIIFAGAAILRLGATLATPSPGKTIGEAMMSGMADWAKVMVGLVLPLLLGAAVLEVVITPKIAFWIFGG